MRTEHDMLRDLHAAKIKMENGKLEAKQWVMTPDGVGLLVGVDLIRPQSGNPYSRPINVVVKGESRMYRLGDVRACTFVEFCFQSTGFGNTPWSFMIVLVAITLIFVASGYWYLMLGAWTMMIGATFRNFKRWMK